MNAALKNDPRFGTEVEFNQFFESAVSWAERCLEDGDRDEVIPKIVAIGRSKDKFDLHTNVYVIASGFNDEKTKWDTVRMVGIQAAKSGFMPLMAAMISEAWRAPEGPCQPKDNPQRVEIVMVSATDILNRWTRGAELIIRRRADNTIEPGKMRVLPDDLKMPLLNEFFVGACKFHQSVFSRKSSTTQN